MTALAAGLLVAGGCDTGGGPPADPDGPSFRFSPDFDTLSVSSTGYTDFQVNSDPPVTFNVQWTLDGEPVGVGRNFRFFAPDLGDMDLQAVASYEDRSAGHRWALHVVADHPLDFSFDPPDTDQALVVSETQRFRVLHTWPFSKTFTWYREGQVVGSDSVYHYTALAEGQDSLRVRVAVDGQILGCDWRLDIGPYRPPAIGEITAEAGVPPASVRITWNAVNPIAAPIADYLVAVRYAGPVSEENWDQAQMLGEVAHVSGESWFRGTFSEVQHGLLPGEQAWFAVRSRDSDGIMSDIEVNAEFEIPASWWISGVVRDEFGRPLPDVELGDGTGLVSAFTGAGGAFRIGPFAVHQRPDLRTLTPDLDFTGEPPTDWHDYRTGPLSQAESEGQAITLIPRYGADPLCASNEGSFMTYFRYMTRTSITTVLRPNQRLYKWDHYPLSVYIPEYSNGDGLDFRANCALTLDMWNNAQGEDYFVLAESPEYADVVFVFDDYGTEANGQTSLLLPDDASYQLGDVIPEKMQVYIHDTLTDAQRIQETSLHELGHVLGINRHALCNGPGYLMYVTAAGVLDDGPENAIHIDELRAVRTIRYLPQGYDMAGF